MQDGVRDGFLGTKVPSGMVDDLTALQPLSVETISKKIITSQLGESLKELLLIYCENRGQENFEKIVEAINSRKIMRKFYLKRRNLFEFQCALWEISAVAYVVANLGTLDQKRQINFVSILKECLEDLHGLNGKISLQDRVQITLEFDEWLFGCLPEHLRENSYRRDSAESLCGLLSCLLIDQAFGESGQYHDLVAELRRASLNLLTWKGKKTQLKAWLDEIYSIRDDFNWAGHREIQNNLFGYVFTHDEILSLFDHDPQIKSVLTYVYDVEHCLAILKSADFQKKHEEKDFEVIVRQMECLADIIINNAFASQSAHWRDQVMIALMLYMGVLYTLKKPHCSIRNDFKNATQQRVMKIIKICEARFLVALNARRQDEISSRPSSDYVQELAEFRERARLEFINIVREDQHSDESLVLRAEKLQVFSDSLVDFLKKFIGSLIASSVAHLGEPPCSYAFIGFGSLDKRSVTPYSDLEFGILIEQDNEINREYFRKLTYILQFKVIQLGETPIPKSIFEYSFDHLTNIGLCFDLGGKISLGRHYDDSENIDTAKKIGQLKYELIGSVDNMVRYVEDEYFAVDKLLPVELCHCTYLAGDPSIVIRYHQILSKRFQEKDSQGRRFCEVRAVELLTGNRFLSGDLSTYSVIFDKKTDETLYDVKKEIYRLPDRLIGDLALFYGVFEGDSAAKVKILAEMKIISQESANNLIIIDGIAKEMRLKTYFHYGRQKEHLSIMPTISDAKIDIFRVNDLRPIKRFYQTVYPFQSAMRKFVDYWDGAVGEDRCFLQPGKLKDTSIMMRLKIARRLGQHKKVQECLMRLQGSDDNNRNPEISYDLGWSYVYSGDYQRAIPCFQEALQMCESLYGDDHIEVAKVLASLAGVYADLGEWIRSIELFERALDIKESVFGHHHLELASTLGNLGTAYGVLRNFEQQLVFLERTITILERDDAENHRDIATALTNLGVAYKNLGDWVMAVMLQERALAIHEQYYGPDHLYVANTLVELSNTYALAGKREKQMLMQERALLIATPYYGANHPLVAKVMMNIGCAYAECGFKGNAVKCLEVALLILERAYSAEHIELAAPLMNLGNVCAEMGDLARGLGLQERALAIRERVYGVGSPLLVFNLTNLGSAYGMMGNTKKQIELQERALAIIEREYGADHLEVALPLTNLAAAYWVMGKWEMALIQGQRALRVREMRLGENHVDVAVTLTVLAGAYGLAGDKSRQISMLERAMAIYACNPGMHQAKKMLAAMSLSQVYALNGGIQPRAQFGIDSGVSLQEASANLGARSITRGFSQNNIQGGLLGQMGLFSPGQQLSLGNDTDVAKVNAADLSLSSIDSLGYSDEDTFLLMDDLQKTSGETNVILGMERADWQGSDIFTENMIGYHELRLAAVKSGAFVEDKVVYPINLGGQHWVLLCIVYPLELQYLPDIYYIDPCGGAPDIEMVSALHHEKLFPGVELIYSEAQPFFANSRDHNVLLIEWARCFLLKGRMPVEGEIDIIDYRSKQKEILENIRGGSVNLGSLSEK